MKSLPFNTYHLFFYIVIYFVGLFFSHIFSRTFQENSHWIKWINNITELHEMVMKCMKDADSPYGFKYLKLHSEKERITEYHRILNATAYYRTWPPKRWSHYRGPWIEDSWISYFCCERPISAFGPFIPLFITWFNIFKRDKPNYQTHLKKILKELKKDFVYITVSSNDLGVEGLYKGHSTPLPQNLFVISASGKGHVPCLMHLKDIYPVSFLPQKYAMAFAGKLTRWQRKRILNESKTLLGNLLYSNRTSDWLLRYRQSGLIMSPRGYARGCFRTAEIFQLGMVPVMIFDDFPWVPYWNSSFPWKDVGFVYLRKEIPQMAKMVKEISQKRIKFMRSVILKYRNSHFTLNATLKQIEMFMKYGFAMSDLRCTQFYKQS
ncbi:hypothetical protein M9Y10_005265 [Tritrichomonas musculus]|uniref:Exostosin GT47 domain-containing protein n=1 Tax=Tritrichomonas musculus TaxID=1915356 RepID=A0ABR2JL59_9EUKA